MDTPNIGISPEYSRAMQEERIIAALECIVKAFEEQNTMNAAYIAEQREWHTEDIGPRIVAIHEQDAQKNEEWRQEQREILEAQVAKQAAMMLTANQALLAHLKMQSHVRATIDVLCERTGVEKPEWNV